MRPTVAADKLQFVVIICILLAETSHGFSLRQPWNTRSRSEADPAARTPVTLPIQRRQARGPTATKTTSLTSTLLHPRTAPEAITTTATTTTSTDMSHTDSDGAMTIDTDCPTGYYLNSVESCCAPLGPLGRVSQAVESWGPLRSVSKAIGSLFGMDTKQISSSGVAFALSYSIISNINGSITLSMAWYLSCKRTGISPLAPGQWKSLLAAYGTLYAAIQLLRPFRVAAAVAMSKLSKEFLDQTQNRLSCSKGAAIAVQYALGWVAWAAVACVGVGMASLSTGVPIFMVGGAE